MCTLKLGLGYSRGHSKPAPLINLLIIGDSIAGRYLTKSQSELETALGSYFSSVTLNDVAISGIASTKYAGDLIPPSGRDYLYDDTSDAFSTEYIDEETANNVTAADITSGVLCVGINDTHPSITFNKVSWKAAYQELVDAVLARYSNMQSLVLVPISRYHGSTVGDLQYQGIREAQEEIAETTAKVYLGSPIYDVDLTDQLHPADAAFTDILAARLAADVNAAQRQSAKRSGPIVSSAVWDGFTVTATASNASDITVPSGGENFYRIEANSTFYTPERVTKGSSATLIADMAGTGIKSIPDFNFYAGYGQMEYLSQTNVEVPSDTLPLAPSTVSVTNKDVISKLTDLAIRGLPTTAAKTLSTNSVTALTDLVAGAYSINAARRPEYDATAFDGAGGLKAPNETTSIQSPAFTAGTGLMVGCVVEFPEDITGNVNILSLGNTSSGRFDATLLGNASGAIVYSDDEAGADVSVANDVEGTRAVILIDFKSTNDADIYYNSATPINFNPDDVFSTRTVLWLFALSDSGDSSTGTIFGDWFVKESAHSGSDPTIQAIIDYWNDKFSVGL